MVSNTDRYKKIIIPIIKKYLPESNIILYGSRARNQERPGSDIDIALDNGSKIEPLLLSNIIDEIEQSDLPINFDIVDLHDVSKDLQGEITKDGVAWQKI